MNDASQDGQAPREPRPAAGAAPPETSTDPADGLSPELLASLALKRAHGGGVAKSGARYFDGGFPTPSYLAGTFDKLAEGGFLALTDPDSWGLQRVTLTTAGHARYAELSGTPRHAGRQVPGPQLPTKTPAGRVSSILALPSPAPGGQPDPHQTRLHLLHPAQVLLATAGGQAKTLCGKRIPTEGLAINSGPWGTLCMACVVGIPTAMRDPGPPSA